MESIIKNSKELENSFVIDFYRKHDKKSSFFNQSSMVCGLLDIISRLIYYIIEQDQKQSKKGRELKIQKVEENKNELKTEFEMSEFSQTEDDEIDRLYQLYEETQKRVDELESNYLSTSYLKDKSTAEILIELWRQAKKDSEIKKIFEKILSNYEGVEKLKFNDKDYTFISLQ